MLVGFVLLGEEREKSVAFILDLSERQAARLKLLETEATQQQLVSVIENSSDFIGIATFAGQAIYVNEAGQQLVGTVQHGRGNAKENIRFHYAGRSTPMSKNILSPL